MKKYITAMVLLLGIFANNICFGISSALDSLEDSKGGTVLVSLSGYVESIIDSIKDMDYGAVADEILFKENLYDPAKDNLNGNGLQGLNRDPVCNVDEETKLSNLRKYIVNLFGDDAWENVDFTIENQIGPNAVSGYKDLRDGKFLNEREYAARSVEYWDQIFAENGIDLNSIDPESEQIMRLTDEFSSGLPFEFTTIPDLGDNMITFSFNGYDLSATGEGPFKMFIIEVNGKFRIYDSFFRDDQYPSDHVYSEKLRVSPLTDNFGSLPQKARSAATDFIANTNVDHLYKHVMKLDCVDDDDLVAEVWIDTQNECIISEAEALKKNEEFIISECSDIGIDYISKGYGKELTSVDLELMSNNKITPDFYPVKPVMSVVNTYELYKIVLFSTEKNSINSEFISFYLSNKKGDYEVISPLCNEHIYDCSISIQNTGD